jgi:hypothetical protein
MVDRPVDITAGTLSEPTVRPDLWLQHIKVTYPDSFFTDLGITRENITLNDIYDEIIQTLESIRQDIPVSSPLYIKYKHEWDAIQNYNIVNGYVSESTLVDTSAPLANLTSDLRSRDLFLFRNKTDIEHFLKIWQEVETDWVNDSFLTTKPNKAKFSAVITSITPSTNTVITLDSSTIVNRASLSDGVYYTF